MEAAVRQKVLIDVVLPEIGADSRAMRLARDAVLVVGFALFMTVLAQIAIRLPNTTVPITAHNLWGSAYRRLARQQTGRP